MGTHLIPFGRAAGGAGGAEASAAADPTRQVLDEVRRLVRFLRVSARRAERSLGISGAQLFALQALEQAGGGPLSVNALAEATRTHQSSVSVVVQKLVDRRLVRRTRSADDARRVELTLAPAARAVLRRSPDSAQSRLIAALEALPPAQVKELARLLGALTGQLGIAGDEAPPLLFEDEAPAPARRRKPARGAARRRSPAA